jgi:hypothetical protein
MMTRIKAPIEMYMSSLLPTTESKRYAIQAKRLITHETEDFDAGEIL